MATVDAADTIAQPLLVGRRVLVTGGSRGIGAAVVDLATRTGARCASISRGGDLDADLRELCSRESLPEPISIAADLGVPQERDRAVAAAAERLGGLDVVVNNAARVSGDVPDGLFTTTSDLLRADFEEKVVTYLEVVRAAHPHLKESGPGGRVVNIGGEAAHLAQDNVSSGARNAAVVHLTHTMARTLGPDRITVNAVQPGVVTTDHVLATLSRAGDDVLERLARRTSLRRLVTPVEVAAVVVFLASSAASGMTGQVLTVSGGTGPAVHY